MAIPDEVEDIAAALRALKGEGPKPEVLAPDKVAIFVGGVEVRGLEDSQPPYRYTDPQRSILTVKAPADLDKEAFQRLWNARRGALTVEEARARLLGGPVVALPPVASATTFDPSRAKIGDELPGGFRVVSTVMACDGEARVSEVTVKFTRCTPVSSHAR